MFFTFSVMQFSLTLTAIHDLGERLNRNKFVRLVFGSEIWALCFILLFQDIPFFMIRLLILIKYSSLKKDYSIYFYVVKNFFLCLFELYRIAIIYFVEKNHHSLQPTTTETTARKEKEKDISIEDNIFYF